ncbi:hypothetical protein BYT27DRAFT_7201143 [Phlegmacium glaucopus]|nr:hypothetical protein BYT27DRAFT_7201143 [Phlegmacium glaucopus]
MHSIFEQISCLSSYGLRRLVRTRRHPLAVYIPKSRPYARIIDRLVRKSSGQFYASTVMKYLNSPNQSAYEAVWLAVQG